MFLESITNDVGKTNSVFIRFQRYRKVQRLSNQVRELRWDQKDACRALSSFGLSHVRIGIKQVVSRLIENCKDDGRTIAICCWMILILLFPSGRRWHSFLRPNAEYIKILHRHSNRHFHLLLYCNKYIPFSKWFRHSNPASSAFFPWRLWQALSFRCPVIPLPLRHC